jgi:hypothetical protein
VNPATTVVRPHPEQFARWLVGLGFPSQPLEPRT